jgi:hypothetical protein
MNLWVSANPGRAPWHRVANGSRKALEAAAREIQSCVSGPVHTVVLDDGFVPDGSRPDADYANSTTFWWVYWDRAACVATRKHWAELPSSFVGSVCRLPSHVSPPNSPHNPTTHSLSHPERAGTLPARGRCAVSRRSVDENGTWISGRL